MNILMELQFGGQCDGVKEEKKWVSFKQYLEPISSGVK